MGESGKEIILEDDDEEGEVDDDGSLLEFSFL